MAGRRGRQRNELPGAGSRHGKSRRRGQPALAIYPVAQFCRVTAGRCGCDGLHQSHTGRRDPSGGIRSRRGLAWCLRVGTCARPSRSGRPGPTSRGLATIPTVHAVRCQYHARHVGPFDECRRVAPYELDCGSRPRGVARCPRGPLGHARHHCRNAVALGGMADDADDPLARRVLGPTAGSARRSSRAHERGHDAGAGTRTHLGPRDRADSRHHLARGNPCVPPAGAGSAASRWR